MASAVVDGLSEANVNCYGTYNIKDGKRHFVTYAGPPIQSKHNAGRTFQNYHCSCGRDWMRLYDR